jgi:hypothetical protein
MLPRFQVASKRQLTHAVKKTSRIKVGILLSRNIFARRHARVRERKLQWLAIDRRFPIAGRLLAVLAMPLSRAAFQIDGTF